MIFVVKFLLFAAFLTSETAAHNGKMAVATPVEGLVVDGDLSDWPEGLTRHPVATTKLDEPDSLDLSARIQFGFDHSRGHLYVAVEVTDQSIVITRKKEGTVSRWQEADGVFLFFGTKHENIVSRSGFLEVGLLGDELFFRDRMKNGNLSEHVQLAGTRPPGGHAYEFAIDLVGLGVDLSDDLVLPLNVHVRDRDAEGFPLPKRQRREVAARWLSWGSGVASDRPRETGDVLILQGPHTPRRALQVAEKAFESGLHDTAVYERKVDLPLNLLTGFACTAALLHLFLYFFHPAGRSNLYYSAFVVFVGAFVYIWSLQGLALPSALLILTTLGFAIAILVLRFLYSLFDLGLPRRFWALVLVSGILLAVLFIEWGIGIPVLPEKLDSDLYGFGFLFLAAIEAIYVLGSVLRNKHRDAAIVAVGFAPYLLSCLLISMSNLLFFGLPWLILVMSIHLARSVARTYKELEDRNLQIERMSRNKSAFLASMSHELRTPMNAIKGFANLVLRRSGDVLPDQQKENLVKVTQASDHLLAMINDLLDLSKIEAGRMDVNPESFSVQALVAYCCATVSPLVEEKPGVNLEYEVGEGMKKANTDQGRLRQMLINLLSNAIKFTDSGSVTVKATRDDGQLVISVSDTGKGIPEDEKNTIFDEYRQVKGSDKEHKGTGLGLSITKKFAELLGGSISVESELGKGTTFTVQIPAVYKEAQV